MEITPPCGDLAVQVGDAVHDRHEGSSGLNCAHLLRRFRAQVEPRLDTPNLGRNHMDQRRIRAGAPDWTGGAKDD